MADTVYTPRKGFLLQESIFLILLENGGRIIIGGSTEYTERPDIVPEI